MIVYHVTPESNLESILEKGLQPSIGKLSSKANEPFSIVCFFESKEAVENGIMNWMGDNLEEDIPLVILECDVDPDAVKPNSDAPWELVSQTEISSDAIQSVYDEAWASIPFSKPHQETSSKIRP